MNFKDINKKINENSIKFIDLRFTDTLSKEHHLTIPASHFSKSIVDNGQPFDGSSISGWQGIENSDMLLKLDLKTFKIDPFYDEPTMAITCNIVDPRTQKAYTKCSRSIAFRAEEYLKKTGIGTHAYFGPEAEFFVFDSVTWGSDISGSHYKIHSEEADWSSSIEYEGGNLGHRPTTKNGYFPLPPVDSLHNLRSEVCLILSELGVPVEIHHHEVASAGQCEIGTKYSTLVERADWSQIFRYVVHNTAHRFGKTATFMPKPLVGDNGSGMHVHQSIWNEDQNLFAGKEYAGLSKLALYYIGGIIKHAKALNAITNCSTNSYKRLVPGFEAPVILAYSSCNRSASIRIPYTSVDKGKRIEVRFPDPLCNPYLAFSAMLMAGLDGIANKIDPGKAMDVNLYELEKSKLRNIPNVCSSLDSALEHLDKDRKFLTVGEVFNDEFIDSYIDLKMQEVTKLRMTTHPVEFSMYYSL